MSFSLSEVMSWTGGRWVNSNEFSPSNADVIRFDRATQLSQSGPSDLAFFFSKAYQKDLLSALPAVLITGEPFVQALQQSGLPLWKKSAIIACADPYGAMAILSEKIAARLSSVAHLVREVHLLDSEAQVHPSAVVHPTAELGMGVSVGPHCVIEQGARIGARTILYSGCYVGPESRVGEDCVFFPHVTLYEWTEVGNRVRIHANSVLGSDGFGYAPKRDGQKVVGHRKIYHLGRVVVGDDVEIGANTCIDRSTFGETRIEKNAKLDNQVHIGHNAFVDEGAVICGGTCLAGRASVGKFALVGGLVGIINDVHVGDGANVAALTLVSKDVPAGSTAVGNPQREYKEHFRAHATLNRLMEERGREREKQK